MSVLRRDFLPDNLRSETQATQVDGVISVQARQTIEETEWLLATSQPHDWIRGVVGWMPLASPNVSEVMERLHDEKKLVGLRHVVQDEPDDGFLARPEFNRGIEAMRKFGWVYDILIYARQLPFAIPFVDNHPEQVFVLDHIAKPTICDGSLDVEWERNIRELAKRPNVYCKFSGVVTEVRDQEWTLNTIQPYWDTAIEAFGAHRMMFGSDWPVCLLRATYQDWIAVVSQLASELSIAEQEQFWSKNAIKAYALG